MGTMTALAMTSEMCIRDREKAMRYPILAASIFLLGTLAGTTGPIRAADGSGDPDFVEEGTASWYGPGFDGKPTASGETFDQDKLTAAHKELPLGVKATVTNLENGKEVEVEINDRGPFVPRRIIDLSKAAAEKLDIDEQGTAPTRVEVESQELEKAESAPETPTSK